jgi:hypothetical protein
MDGEEAPMNDEASTISIIIIIIIIRVVGRRAAAPDHMTKEASLDDFNHLTCMD